MDTILTAVWCIDSETGEEWMIDTRTGEKIMSRSELNGPVA
jgi:hypothetical protein